MIKVTLICERCGVNHEKDIDLRDSTITFKIEEISKFNLFNLKAGEACLLCPDCLEKLYVVLDENSEESDRKIRVFLHREA